MIGSFWNLCRACPSMPVDKLHSEYRSTYRWHEYTGPRQEVIRRAPQGGTQNPHPSDEKRHDFGNATRIDEESHELPKLEPALPRRKKHPDLAYRHHEFIVSDGNNFGDFQDNFGDRAKSEERGVSHWRPSRRSKSEGPARSTRSHALVNGERRRDSDPDIPESENTGRDSGLLKKAISKISTEYRLQFAWPQGHTSRRDATDSSAPRKSQSMGALKPAANAIIHRKRTDFEHTDGTASELEPLVNDTNTIKEEEYNIKPHYEYKKECSVFSHHEFIDKKSNKMDDVSEEPTKLVNGTTSECYKDLIELRKKAVEYKSRGWGSQLASEEKPSDIYNKHVELWDQVSRRSSLSALSLASTAHRTYTKEEKNQENTKKSSPTKALRNAENSARIMKEMIRHHLGRTTGGSEFDGLILSPTREKLEPTIPKRDDDSRGSQKNSPKKSSPQKLALQKKNSIKSKSALKTARSQSVGPTDMTSTEKRSPKRQSRSAVKEKERKSTPSSTSTTNSNSVPVTKRPRPSSLNTTASSRSKSSSGPLKHEEDRLAKSKPNKNNSNESKSHNSKEQRKGNSASENVKTAPEVSEPEPIDLEPVIKSPPEPTRVKSPEQIIMRSPDPVNWTVPLDTGKTFTVTQNVREGDLTARPHSEVKAWTPPDVPPPVAQSAPPQLTQLTDQCKDQARRCSIPNSSKNSNNSAFSKINSNRENCKEDSQIINGNQSGILNSPMDEKIGITSCSIDHIDEPEPSESILTQTAALSPTQPLAKNVLQKARERFDNFWGGNSKEDV